MDGHDGDSSHNLKMDSLTADLSHFVLLLLHLIARFPWCLYSGCFFFCLILLRRMFEGGNSGLLSRQASALCWQLQDVGYSGCHDLRLRLARRKQLGFF